MHDLIVIGGGPAGASAAQKAASAGLHVLVLEKTFFPRHKPCGGALSERAISYIDPGIPASIIENEIYGARITYKGNTVEVFREDRIALLISRDKFDHYLLECAKAAGADVRFEKVIDFIEQDDFVSVLAKQGNEYRAKYVIVAEGAQGKLKYKIKARDGKDPCGLGLVTTMALENPGGTRVAQNLMEFQFGFMPTGYGWIFPHKVECSAGIYGVASQMKKAKQTFQELFAHMNPQAASLKGHIVPLGWPKKKLAGKRTLLCGDAGGFVDSFSGEGISYAIRSGQLAAEKIITCVGEPGGKYLATYEKACRDEFDDNLKYAYIFLKYVSQYPDLFFPIFTREKKYISLYLDISAMKITYKQLFIHLLPRCFPYLPGLALNNIRSKVFRNKPAK